LSLLNEKQVGLFFWLFYLDLPTWLITCFCFYSWVTLWRVEKTKQTFEISEAVC
jgi:hypothetical protein